MRNFQHRRGWRNIIESKPVLIFGGILVIIFAYSLIGFIGKMQETSRNKEIAANKIAELQKEKDKLSTDIANLKTDAGVEASIREKFGLAKEGEGEIVIVEDKNAPVVNTASAGGFFSFFTKWFK